MGSSSEDRIAFFDVETTMPTRPGQGRAILEFGAILVCPRTAVEKDCYSTLVKPPDIFLHSFVSRANGITRDALASAPTFLDIADSVYKLLHGRIWAGHNIRSFDCVRIREAFEEIGKPAPEPKDTLDTFLLLRRSFGNRAGNMQMDTLAKYFGLGKQKHRSLDDVRLNLKVFQYCATVLSWSLCKVLDACDGIAQKLYLDPGSSSEWRPIVTRKNGFVNYPTVRLHIPTAITGDGAVYATEMYQKDSGIVQRALVFSRFDAAELDPLFTPGTFVDAFFSLDPYDYQQNAGIRLVAKKLIIHSN